MMPKLEISVLLKKSKIVFLSKYNIILIPFIYKVLLKSQKRRLKDMMRPCSLA